MPDPLTIVSGISAVKTTFDALRTAIGLVKDTKDLLPKWRKLTLAEFIAESFCYLRLGNLRCKRGSSPSAGGVEMPRFDRRTVSAKRYYDLVRPLTAMRVYTARREKRTSGARNGHRAHTPNY